MFPLIHTGINGEPTPERLIISANDAVNFKYGNAAFKWRDFIKQQQKQVERKKKNHSHI